jgi:dipeptidyl aminopeptidase/acylaminoacyl peptidase
MRDKFFFSNDNGFKLCGVISDPKGKAGSPVIMLCHGLSTSKDGRTYTRLETMLNRKGIATFRFDFFGHGESEGKFEDITLSEAAKDILKAVHILKSSGYSKIGLMGSSFGGYASLMAASRLPELILLALKSPVSDYLGLLIAKDQEIDISLWKLKGSISMEGIDNQSLKLNYTFFQDAETIQSAEAIRKIKAPTLIVHGDADKTVPVEQSIQCARMMEDCQLKILEGADHTYTQPRHFEQMLSSITDFIIRYGLFVR